MVKVELGRDEALAVLKELEMLRFDDVDEDKEVLINNARLALKEVLNAQ